MIASLEMDEETERRLLANNPGVTSVAFRSSYHRPIPQADDLERMVKALGQSTHVTALTIDFSFFDEIVGGGLSKGSGLKQLGLWIESQPKLQILYLHSTCLQWRFTASLLLPDFISAICNRNQHGPSCLKEVALHSLEVEADDLVKLFDASDLLKEFCMKSCIIQQGSFATETLAAQKVAESLAAVKHLSILDLGVTNENQAYFVAILAQVQSHTSITRLKFRDHTRNLPISALNAIANLLQNATKEGLWKALHFESFDWTDASMGPIARSICTSNIRLQELYFDGGSMDNASIEHLQSIFSPQSIMNTLWFDGIMFSFTDDVTPDILEAFVSASSSLNDICLPWFGFKKKGRKLFRAVLRGLKAASCGIHKLSFESSLSNDNLTALAKAIPFFTSVTHIYLGDDFLGRELKSKLLKAVCRNRKLVASNLEFYSEFDEWEHVRLEAYMERNRSLVPTIQSTIKSIGVLEHNEEDDSVGSTGSDIGNGSLLPTLFGRPDCSLMTEPTLVFRALVQLEEGVGPEETVGSKRRAVTESPTSVPSKRLKLQTSMLEASAP